MHTIPDDETSFRAELYISLCFPQERQNPSQLQGPWFNLDFGFLSILHVLPMLVRVSSGFSGFLPLLENILVFGLVTIGVKESVPASCQKFPKWASDLQV